MSIFKKLCIGLANQCKKKPKNTKELCPVSTIEDFCPLDLSVDCLNVDSLDWAKVLLEEAKVEKI